MCMTAKPWGTLQQGNGKDPGEDTGKPVSIEWEGVKVVSQESVEGHRMTLTSNTRGLI